MVFGVFSPGRTHCIAPKKLPDKAMSIWNLHKKFQLSSAMGLRDFDLQSQPTLMGGEPINCRAMVGQCCVQLSNGRTVLCLTVQWWDIACHNVQ